MNTTTLALPRLRVEAAVAAYIRNFYDVRATQEDFDKMTLDVNCRREGTPLDQVPIVEGQSPINYNLPCVVVNCVKASPLVPGDTESAMTEVRVEIHALTQLAEGSDVDTYNNAAQRHADRLAQLVELLLGDVNLVMATLSSDEAPIKDLIVFGMWLEDEDSQQAELHWDDTLVFMFHCCAFNSDS